MNSFRFLIKPKHLWDKCFISRYDQFIIEDKINKYTKYQNGASDGARTRDLRRDRPAL